MQGEVADQAEVSYVLSKRGHKQLVLDGKIYNMNKNTKDADGRIIKRNWRCINNKVCSATCTTSHTATDDDSYDVPHITDLKTSGEHHCEITNEEIGNKRTRQAIIDTAVAREITPSAAHAVVFDGVVAGPHAPSTDHIHIII